MKKRYISLILLVLILTAGIIHAQNPPRPTGLTVHDEARVADGYMLVTTIQSPQILLLSNDGRIVHMWESAYYPRNAAYLTDAGHLVRPTYTPEIPFGVRGRAGFSNGIVEELTWDGEIVWSVNVFDERVTGHHDAFLLPNGNLLALVFERFSAEEAIAAGRNPGLIPENGELWSETLQEIDVETGEIVWEWRAWDHLIQSEDPDMANYGDISAHPERIDLNYVDAGVQLEPNFLHVNGIAYHPERDEILLSVRKYSEFWIIDHATTTEEARGEAGDLLYRWGNPEAYDTGSFTDRHLFFQHNITWIPEGLPGAGNVLIFNNGGPQRDYSSVIEITPDVDAKGDYVMLADTPTSPDEFAWEYVSDPPQAFFSALISSAQRQPNGNTLITEGVKGRIFEVTAEGDIVWEYFMPLPLWIFRAERYDLSVFETLDLTQDLPIATGAMWETICDDGREMRLYEWSLQNGQRMGELRQAHGEDAEVMWRVEACEPEVDE